ncbi:TPA: hypothetical protein NG505_000382 [Vibrio parahaemolyticus]|nr:hypothetical protein [Vibrio parahaemolyticus]
MEEKLFELLKPWAGNPTWYTTHPMDRDRFYKAMHSIVDQLGTSIDMDEFESALRKHAEENPAVLGNPKHWDNVIEKFTIMAESIFSYEHVR